MLATIAFTLQVANIVLLVVGSLCFVGFGISLVRSGRWRNPLARVAIPQSGPDILAAAAVLLVFIALQVATSSVLGRERPAETEVPPGSEAWYWDNAGGAVTSVLVGVLMVVALARARPPESARRQRVGVFANSAAGVLGLLIFLPLAEVQLQMGQIVWNWFHPDVAPPTHVVLQAFARNEWGVWGIVQLLAGAVLIAPITEELFFRGILLQAICYHFPRAWGAVTVSGVAFGLVHLSQPHAVLPMLTMGLVLGYLRLRCGSIWPCVLLHVLFNARTMLFVVLAPELLETV